MPNTFHCSDYGNDNPSSQAVLLGGKPPGHWRTSVLRTEHLGNTTKRSIYRKFYLTTLRPP